jgi:hypothetical protein
MGNLELAWIMGNVKDYNLDMAVDLMQGIDSRLSAVKQQIDECCLDDVVKMLDLMDQENNLEIAYDIVEERIDKLLEDELEHTFAMLEWLKEY